MLYVEDKCLVESPPILGIKQCTDNLTYVDTNGANCTTYHQNNSLCGKSDSDDFNSLEMCCACNGGTLGYANMTSE